MKYDRFNLEEEIQSVWASVEDLDTILYRIMDATDGPPSEDDITTMLMGLKEIHNSRCMKLWDVFETMVQQKNSFLHLVSCNSLRPIRRFEISSSVSGPSGSS